MIGHEMILLIESAPADRRRTNERTIRAETSTPKLTAPRKIKLCAQCDLVVCSSEERIAEAKRYRTSDNSEA